MTPADHIAAADLQEFPFPHVAIDGMWPDELLRGVIREFPHPTAPGWQQFDNNLERKKARLLPTGDPWSAQLEAEIAGLAPALSAKFDMPDLVVDWRGGGMHLIEPGGYLATHIDFDRAINGLWRRLNAIVYLNPWWLDGWGGELELADQADRISLSIPPLYNRTVIFETSNRSWHGHPNPTTGDFHRRSVAAYFYNTQPPRGVEVGSIPHDTIFR